jgi:hypothetical protein
MITSIKSKDSQLENDINKINALENDIKNALTSVRYRCDLVIYLIN